MFQLLLYPSTDLAGTYASRSEFASGPMVSGRELEWYIECYVEDRSQLANPLVSPLRAETLAGLPDAIIVTAGNDMLRDEGLAYASALARSGVAISQFHYPTMVHGFLLLTDVSSCAAGALHTIGALVRSRFDELRTRADD